MLLTKRQFLTSVLALSVSAAARAAGGPSGPAVHFQSQGKIGEVFVNPYKIAPLTAVIGNGGYELRNASVRIVPKPNGQEIAYSVADRLCRTHGGIPVFGLYPDYQNTVEVEYDRVANDAARTVEHIRESYKIYAGPAYIGSDGTDQQTGGWFRAEVLKCAPKYKDRLYLVNNILENNPRGGRAVWNNPAGGALQWGGSPEVGIIDSTGALRWYLMPDSIFEPNSIEWGGVMMGFRQNKDGALTWGYGQRYVKYDILGRRIWNRLLPEGYDDFSHALEPMENGHYLIRVSDANYRRADGRNVRTVRDVIIEVNEAGEVVDDWNLNNILDPYRSTVIKTLDQGAVCLNIDVDKAGKTMTAEELAKLDASDDFGDILGTGPGRNWAHVNSVDYDPTDDSIIVSSRHQSAIIKIGRDKKVKWSIGSHEGWKKPFADKLLTPVDASGKPIACDKFMNHCENKFDWTWTQHTAWRINEKSKKGDVYLTVFDNGDGRGMEQPALADMKYTRLVVYRVNESKMTIEQIWTYGEEKGHDYYSPVTGLCEYAGDKDSVVGYFSTAGMRVSKGKAMPSPYLTEFDWGAKEPSVVMHLKDTFGYQAWPFSIQEAMKPSK